ncbi:MAG: 50S ribosomal protein L6 [Mogibacterium sp.]|nr:50S ribosomal protein L6 [Oscillospiraceae bacterium]MBR2806553.1 50S ribosomal protein L6 [Oscillospiraceae bacterium]MBR3125788.1 50S ribosomal protein L6 [Mogibacterium sp.]
MSRIGRKPIDIPAGVDVKLDGNTVTVTGPKGTLSETFAPSMKIEMDDGKLTVSRPSDDKEYRSLHGLTRTLIRNMVQGVTEGFTKELEVKGVGYRAAKEGTDLVLNLGYSHQVRVPDTEDVKTEVPKPDQIIISGIDKQKVGQFAADVRAKRPPEPYKGKGIRYKGEFVRHKEGKAGKSGK